VAARAMSRWGGDGMATGKCVGTWGDDGTVSSWEVGWWRRGEPRVRGVATLRSGVQVWFGCLARIRVRTLYRAMYFLGFWL
jgi:hypothetical protein